MRVLLPWNMANYIPLNGFHPLYQSVANIDCDSVDLVVPALSTKKSYNALLKWKSERQKNRPIPDWILAENLYDAWNEYISCTERRIVDEIYYTSDLDADVEFHHTAPITEGIRPFFLHMESLLPMFFPFLQQGRHIDRRRLNRIVPLYKAMLENERCMGILSHIPQTLDQISKLFRSNKIDSKLHLTPIELAEVYISANETRNKRNAYENICRVLFLSSAHQVNTFELRGGFVVMKAALNLLKQGYAIQFHFRCLKPQKSEFLHMNINIEEIDTYENKNIFWHQHYLSQDDLNSLVASADFLACPSANLHSVSIMSGLANGAIPIVTDTIGTDLYVNDGDTGIILKGVSERIWRKHDEVELIYDDHERFTACTHNLAEQMVSRLKYFLDRRTDIAAMQKRCREHFKKNFSRDRFKTWLEEYFQNIRYRINDNHVVSSHRACNVEGLDMTDFGGPTHPVVVDRIPDSGTVFRIANRFIFLPINKIADHKVFSPLSIADDEYSENKQLIARVAVFESFDKAYIYAIGFRDYYTERSSIDRGSVSKYLTSKIITVRRYGIDSLFKIASLVSIRLINYPFLHRGARKIWTYLRYILRI